MTTGRINQVSTIESKTQRLPLSRRPQASIKMQRKKGKDKQLSILLQFSFSFKRFLFEFNNKEFIRTSNSSIFRSEPSNIPHQVSFVSNHWDYLPEMQIQARATFTIGGLLKFWVHPISASFLIRQILLPVSLSHDLGWISLNSEKSSHHSSHPYCSVAKTTIPYKYPPSSHTQELGHPHHFFSDEHPPSLPCSGEAVQSVERNVLGIKPTKDKGQSTHPPDSRKG